MPLRSEPVTLAMGAAIAFAIVGWAAAATAADIAPVAASLDVVAPAACTTREEVVARIAARSSRIRLRAGPGGGDAPAFRAAIAPGPAGTVTAELTIAQPGGGRSIRKLTARSCTDAADAVALVIVIALDPSSLAAGDTAAAGAAGKPADGDAAAAAPGPTAQPPPPPPSPPPPSPSPPPPPPPPPPEAETAVAAAPPEPEPPPARARYGAGVFGGAVFGPAPRPMPGFGVEVVAALERESFWSPALVLRGMHAWTNDLPALGSTAAFALDALALDACPMRLRAAILEARACGAALVGRLSAAGSYTYSPHSETRPFATLGGAAFLTLELGRHVTLSGRFGLGASRVRDAFAFHPMQFHRVAAVVVGVDVGVGVRFP